jgi:hypothetical protein
MAEDKQMEIHEVQINHLSALQAADEVARSKDAGTFQYTTG